MNNCPYERLFSQVLFQFQIKKNSIIKLMGYFQWINIYCAHGATTLSIMTFSITILCITIKKRDAWHKDIQHNDRALLCWVQHNYRFLLWWMSLISPLCWDFSGWVSLYWKLLCWVSWRPVNQSEFVQACHFGAWPFGQLVNWSFHLTKKLKNWNRTTHFTRYLSGSTERSSVNDQWKGRL